MNRHRVLWSMSRAAAWIAIAVATAVTTRHLGPGLIVGALMLVAAAAVQFTGDERTVRTSTVAIVLATVVGLICVLVAPKGLGEVPVFVAASKIAFPINRGPGRVFLVIDSLAVAAVVAYVSHSLVGVLAGLGIPQLAQRAVERRELIRARDEAQALLVEVRAGRDAEAEAAALRERGRIARDLHDVLAHSLAGLSVQLQAARAVAAREGVGASVLAPLDTAASLAKDGLTEARAVVGALRDPGGLGIDAIATLVERHPGPATLQFVGAPVHIAPEAGHAAYRAVQEALTNAARYAPGAAVSVTLTWTADGIGVDVEDAGLPSGHAAITGQGSGLGLAGMDERVRAVGGTLTAGPRGDGGWRVQVQVPAPAGAERP